MKPISSRNDSKSSRMRLTDSVDVDDLFDGRTWELGKGEDFDCSTSSAAALVRAAFRERYGQLIIRQTAENNTIQVTAVPGTRWRKS